MVSRNFLFVIGLIFICATEAGQPKLTHTKLYFSYHICESSGKCKSFTPTKNADHYLFKKLQPAHDEFYVKDHDGDFYLYYKNIYSEDVQVGWAKAQKLTNNNERELNLEIDKINLALGGVDFIKNGYANKQAESKNFKLGLYYLEDHYEGAPYYQKQKIVFKKTAGNLFLECDSYMANPSVKEGFYGIFYGVCSEGKKVYFKKIS